jgi:hypothetical protein
MQEVAGFDADAFVPPRPEVRPLIGAVRFLLNGRQFAVGYDGQMGAMHPVDQAVEFTLGFELGSISSLPQFGVRLDRLEDAIPSRLSKIADDEVRDALAVLTHRRDITVVSVTVVKDGWPVYIEVVYKNLRSNLLMTAHVNWSAT